MLNLTRAAMIQAGLPKNLWAEALKHIIWVMNRTRTSIISEDKILYEMATGEKPNLEGLQRWGSVVWVRKLYTKSWDDRVAKERFMGFYEKYKGIRVYWPLKKIVTVEQDIYWDKESATREETIQIEGEYDDFITPTNFDTSNSSKSNVHPTQQS